MLMKNTLCSYWCFMVLFACPLENNRVLSVDVFSVVCLLLNSN